MAQFFIDRPIFAWVIAIIIMLAGALAIKVLPVSQYPAIAPPEISINALYPGASAITVENTVTQVIEQKMNGIDHLRYMSSDERFVRLRDDRAHLRRRDRSQHRAGAGAEQAATGHAAAAPDGPAAGDQGHQINQEFSHDRRGGVGRRQHEPVRPVGLHRGQHPGPHQPPGRGGRGARVRFPVFHANLDRSRQAEQLQADPVPTFRRRSRAQNIQVSAGQLGGDARRQGPAAQCGHHCTDAPGNPRAVRGHPAAHEP